MAASGVFRSDERSKILRALKSALAPIGPQQIAAVSSMKDANVRRFARQNGRFWGNDRLLRARRCRPRSAASNFNTVVNSPKIRAESTMSRRITPRIR
jgi:hypothetical protein